MNEKSAAANKNWFSKFFTEENKILLLLLFFGIFFRFLTITTIETGGDAANYWFAAKRIIHGLPYTLNHHTVRFGMILPITITQYLFGTHPIVYYITPLFFYILQIIFLYKIVTRVAGINIAFISSILLILLPKMFSHAVQLKPDTFSAAYILISVWFIFKFYDSKTHNYSYLFAAALSMFMAYLTKETSLFFLPGLAISILMMKKNFKYILFFGAILFFLFLCETTLYYIVAGIRLGRAQIVAGSHLSSSNLLALPSLWSLFGRYAQLNIFEKLYFFTYIISTCYIVLQYKKIKLAVTMQSLIIIPLVFFFLLTFAIKSIVPIVPAMSFNPRHLVPVAPFMIFIIAYAIVTGYKSLRQPSSSHKNVSEYNTIITVSRFVWIIVLLCIISTIVVMIALPNIPQAGRTTILKEHPFIETFRHYRLLNYAYTNGIPIIQEKVVADRWRKPVQAVELYLNQGYSLQEACKKANVTEKDYLYCLKRVNEGDYKTFKIFTHVYWKIDSKTLNNFSFPEMEKAIVKSKSIGYLLNESFKDKHKYIISYLSNNNKYVVVMYEKPFRVKKMTVREFLQ